MVLDFYKIFKYCKLLDEIYGLCNGKTGTCVVALMASDEYVQVRRHVGSGRAGAQARAALKGGEADASTLPAR